MSIKPEIRVGIVDFWEMTAQEKKRYISIFQRKYKVIEDEINPDILFYSCFGDKHLEYNNCKKIFYTGENVTPDFNTCDYAISTVKIKYSDKCIWIPEAHWASRSMEENYKDIDERKLLSRRKFCSFIYNNESTGHGAKLRKIFCKQLMQYKEIDCPGKVLHNMDSNLLSNRMDPENWHNSKILFISNYKFNIAFENSEAPGYITEKLVDCYMANTVPIYWGSSGDVYPYPKESMICANDYKTVDELIARIQEVDNDDELYIKILGANPFRKENRPCLPDFQEQLCNFISKIIGSNNEPERILLPITDAQRCYKYKKLLDRPHIKIILKIEHIIKKFVYIAKVKCRRIFNFFRKR